MAAVHASWPSEGEAAEGATRHDTTRHGARERRQWASVGEAK
jgi:hypothetical protein